MSSTTPRMLLVEEALKTESGHWYEYVKSIVDMNGLAGAETVVVSHAETERQIRDELNAYPIFKWTNWDNIYNHPKAWRRYLGIALHNYRVFRTMSRFVREHGPFDVLFAPTVVIYHIIGWRLLMAFQGRRIGQMVLLMRNNAGSYEPGNPSPVFKRSTVILRWAMRSFLGLAATGRVRFATDTQRLAAEYKALSGIEPEVFPSARISPPPVSGKTGDSKDKIVFTSLGPARLEKGIDVAQAAIRAYLQSHPQSRAYFYIQWNEPIVGRDGGPYLPDSVLQSHPRVRFLTSKMSTAEYDALVGDTDCVLMPYRRESYFARGSGVALEAVTAGVPLIYTLDTWVEDLVEEMGSGIGVSDGDSDGCAAAINAMTEQFESFSLQARERAEIARTAHSSQAFLAKIWGKGKRQPSARA